MATADHAQDPQPPGPAEHASETAASAGSPKLLKAHDPDWWSEATDGRCSTTAALFAESQPAPLSIV